MKRNDEINIRRSIKFLKKKKKLKWERDIQRNEDVKRYDEQTALNINKQYRFGNCLISKHSTPADIKEYKSLQNVHKEEERNTCRILNFIERKTRLKYKKDKAFLQQQHNIKIVHDLKDNDSKGIYYLITSFKLIHSLT